MDHGCAEAAASVLRFVHCASARGGAQGGELSGSWAAKPWRRSVGVLSGALLIAGCGGTADLEPREAASTACRQLAVSQYGREDAEVDEVEDVDEAASGAVEAFEVTGTAGEVEWICTHTTTRTQVTVQTETSIDKR